MLWRVVFEAQARVGEVGGENIGRGLLFGLGQAKRSLVLAKNGVRFVRVPRRMAYFKCKSKGGRAQGKKIFQEGSVELEGGRELDEDWAEMVAVVKDAADFQETLQSALAPAKPLNVGDLLVGL